jgi:hypothetical protein
MSQRPTLARPYARAAFALASETGSLPAWSQQLDTAAQIAADERVGHILGNPGVRAEVMAGMVAVPGQTHADPAQPLRNQRTDQEPHREGEARRRSAQRGHRVSVSDGIVRIHGLADVMYGEMIDCPATPSAGAEPRARLGRRGGAG